MNLSDVEIIDARIMYKIDPSSCCSIPLNSYVRVSLLPNQVNPLPDNLDAWIFVLYVVMQGKWKKLMEKQPAATQFRLNVHRCLHICQQDIIH